MKVIVLWYGVMSGWAEIERYDDDGAVILKPFRDGDWPWRLPPSMIMEHILDMPIEHFISKFEPWQITPPWNRNAGPEYRKSKDQRRNHLGEIK